MAKAREDWMPNVAGSMDDTVPVDVPMAASAAEKQREGRRRLEGGALIRVDRLIRDPHQPRTEFDEEGLRRLALSLKDRGQLQPIRVRWDEAEGHYVVVTGERRWRAAQLAGLEALACVVMTSPVAAEDLLEDQLIENCLREDLKPIEQARAYKSLMDSRGLSQRQLAERLQIGHPAIAKALADFCTYLTRSRSQWSGARLPREPLTNCPRWKISPNRPGSPGRRRRGS